MRDSSDMDRASATAALPEVGFDGEDYFTVPTHDEDGRPYTKRQMASLKMWALRRRKRGEDGPARETVRSLRKDGRELMRQVVGEAKPAEATAYGEARGPDGQSLRFRLATPKKAALARPPRPKVPSPRPSLSRQADGIWVLPQGKKAYTAADKPKPKPVAPPPVAKTPASPTGLYREIKRLLALYRVALADKARADRARGLDAPEDLRRLLPRQYTSANRRAAIREELTEHHTIAEAERCQPPPRRPRPQSSRLGLPVLPPDLRERLDAMEADLRKRVPEDLRDLCDQLTRQVKGCLQAGMGMDEAD